MRLLLSVGLGLCFAPLVAVAQQNCARPELANQKRDAATVERLEHAWTDAYMSGDTAFEECLLLPDFHEIKSNGKVGNLSDELAVAAKNKGKNLPPVEFHSPEVLMHDDVAVAHGDVHFKDAKGTEHEMHYADYYHWENGSWRVFFAQQTSVPNGS